MFGHEVEASWVTFVSIDGLAGQLIFLRAIFYFNNNDDTNNKFGEDISEKIGSTISEIYTLKVK
jgi:hypothetical protein